MSSSTLQRYSDDINMLSPYRIDPNNTNKRTKKVKNTDFDNNSHHEADVKRLQMTSNDLKTTRTKPNKKSKNVLEAGSIQEYVEINEHYIDKFLRNNNS